MPEFLIKENHKFGCLSISAWIERDLTQPLEVEENLWFLFSPPFPMSDIWKEWLGTIKADEFLENNFFIIATQPSTNIAVANHENKALETKVTQLYYSLLLHGVARCNDRGFILTGSNQANEVEIRSNSSLFSHFNTAHVRPKLIDNGTITNALRISKIIDNIYNTSETYMRFKKGFDKYLRGLREPFPGDRLHQFVRAIEAIIKPDVGSTRRQFIHRCQTFICRSKAISDLLGEIYDLRCGIEHLHGLSDSFCKYKSLCKYDKKDIEKIACLRAYQTELITEYLYLKIIGSSTLLNNFLNDKTIDAFWQKQDHERFNLWGNTLDVEAISNSQFCYQEINANQ